jgi:hypothetical protein
MKRNRSFLQVVHSLLHFVDIGVESFFTSALWKYRRRIAKVILQIARYFGNGNDS